MNVKVQHSLMSRTEMRVCHHPGLRPRSVHGTAARREAKSARRISYRHNRMNLPNTVISPWGGIGRKNVQRSR